MAEIRFRPERKPVSDERVLGLALLLLVVGAVLVARPWWAPTPAPGLLVEVSGEVASPGLYRVEPPTVAAAVEAAGGLAGDEPAVRLYEGDAVVVEASGARVVPAGNPLLVALPVDLDRHGVEALAVVPGIGQALAEEIVASRERQGPFGDAAALERLEGVGPHRVDRIRPFVVATGTPRPPGPVDLNRATAKELEALPGVGPVLAARIVADREARGLFADIDALDRVSGIGPALVARLDGEATAQP